MQASLPKPKASLCTSPIPMIPCPVMLCYAIFFQLLKMQSAKEKAVVFFPRSCISLSQHYTRVARLAVSNERIVVDVAEGEDQRAPGFVYEFDYSLHLVNVTATGTQTLQRHQELEALGKLDHSFDLQNECARLRDGVVVRRER